MIRSAFYMLLLVFVSCASADNKNATYENSVPINTGNQNDEIKSYFPVTSYLKGQIMEISTGNANPLKIVRIKNRVDSSYVKMESLKDELAGFLSPEIDSINLISLFKEEKFLDETLNAVTMTYDPIKPLPDSFELRHWDVYISPETGLVRRIYILKKLPENRTVQLTWQSGKNCSIVSIIDSANGHSAIEKEVFFNWNPGKE